MKLKRIVQVIVMGYAAFALSACSTTGKNHSGSGAQDQAQSSGLGDNQGFGGDDSKLTPEQLLAKRTYYFSFDRSEVRPQDKRAIIANADYLVAHPHAQITLEGHTDPRGSREYNVGLGERRANAVLEVLKSRGVNPNQVHVVSYGAERLASPGHTEEDYQRDRRAVIIYTQN